MSCITTFVLVQGARTQSQPQSQQVFPEKARTAVEMQGPTDDSMNCLEVPARDATSTWHGIGSIKKGTIIRRFSRATSRHVPARKGRSMQQAGLEGASPICYLPHVDVTVGFPDVARDFRQRCKEKLAHMYGVRHVSPYCQLKFQPQLAKTKTGARLGVGGEGKKSLIETGVELSNQSPSSS
ncbi:hypothetical protein B0H12DRAFT_1296033 [Mycena haematopus]|nr:hypothetical protein B0H12DRAFT_1296033 [Mycena haematopus]